MGMMANGRSRRCHRPAHRWAGHEAASRPLCRRNPSPSTATRPSTPSKGLVGVDLRRTSSGSPTYPLDVFAALSADRKKLAISVVNPTETSQDCDLSLTGVEPAGAARLWQLTAPAGARAAVPAPGRGGFGVGPPATMAERPLTQAPRKFTLPPGSVSVYEFEVK